MNNVSVNVLVAVGQKPGFDRRSDKGQGSVQRTNPRRDGFTNIDVTSGSMNKINNRSARVLSPLYLGPVVDSDGDKALRFENYWQYLKVYPQLGHWDQINKKPTDKWIMWKQHGFLLLKGKKGIRTPPEVSALKRKYNEACNATYKNKAEKDKAINDAKWVPIGHWFNGKLLGYIEARKQIYVPTYAKLIKKKQVIKDMKKMITKGDKLMILDLDGPPRKSYPTGLLMTDDNWETMINDEKYPFGHGYVVAALVAGLMI